MRVTAENLDDLRTGFQAAFQKGFDGAQETVFYQDVATVVPSTSDSETYGWLGDFPDLREWVGDRVIKQLGRQGYRITNRLFESTVGVKRTDIEDDKLGTYAPRFEAMGKSAARHPQKLVIEVINGGRTGECYDGQNFFDTDHPIYPETDGTGTPELVANYVDGTAPGWVLLDTTQVLNPFIFQERLKPEFDNLDDAEKSDHVFMKDEYLMGIRARSNGGYGMWQCAYVSKEVLNAQNFEAARTAMGKFTADGGRNLGIRPSIILVPSELESAANQLFKAQNLPGGGSNVNFNAVEVKVIPQLAL